MDYTVYKTATGEITSTCSAPEGYEPPLLAGEASLPIKANASLNYFIGTTLYEYTESELTERLKLGLDGKYAWKMPERVLVDNRSLDDVKSDQRAKVKAARDLAEAQGFVWDGSIFDSDLTSQSRIAGAVQLAMMSPAFEIEWILKDNTMRTLNAAEMMQVGAALGTHVSTLFAQGAALRQEILNATTAEAALAVNWPS